MGLNLPAFSLHPVAYRASTQSSTLFIFMFNDNGDVDIDGIRETDEVEDNSETSGHKVKYKIHTK